MTTRNIIRVIIAEDDFLVSKEISRAVKNIGYEVVAEVSTGELTIEKTCELKPDVVLMDIQMPGMDGIQASEEIQKRCPTPIVILTAYESQNLVEQASNAGVGGYLTKPPKAQEIARAITIAISRHADFVAYRQLKEKLIEGTTEGTWEWDIKSGQLTFSKNWYEVLGYTEGEREFDFKWWQENLHPEHLPLFTKALKYYREGKTKYFELEYQIRDKSGKWKWLRTRGITSKYDKDGAPLKMIGNHRNITYRRHIDESLLKAHDKLEQKSLRLEESSIALKVFLEQRSADKENLEEEMLYNVKNLVQPYLEKLKNSPLTSRQKELIEVIEQNLESIIAPFAPESTDLFSLLTPAEIQVANLTKQDKTSKNIAAMLNLSPATIATHKQRIRKKFGITNKKTNLRTFLRSN